MTEYIVPEETNVGQLILELSGVAGSLVDTIVSKTYVEDSLEYLIESATALRDELKNNPHVLDGYMTSRYC